jgi:lysophospholipase L1-like esterase
MPVMAILLLTGFGMILGVGAAEALLRIVGFHFDTFPIVQFGWPEPHVIDQHFVADRELFWVPRDYAAVLANARKDPPDITFLGDSCTEFGTWPEATIMTLRARAKAHRGLKLAVAGWSSVQGLAQFRRDVLPLRPRVATVYFGWNDHWAALGVPDKDARPSRATFWLSQHSRLAQAVAKARAGLIHLDGNSPVRVDLATYQSDLETIAREGGAAGIQVVLITAPSGHQAGQEPTYLAKRHIANLHDLIPLHQRYVDATRRSARATGAFLCDAAAGFSGLPAPVTRYFIRDGIHFSPAGNRAMAALVTQCVEEALRLPARSAGAAR